VKKLKDIYTWELEESLDIRNPERITSPEVSNTSWEKLDDFIAWEKKDISLYERQNIIVEKKWWKHFDALEKRPAFSSLFLMKDIKLKKRKKGFSMWPYIIEGQRYIKSAWIFWIWILIFITLSGVIILGLLDKVIVENRVNAGYQKLLEVKNWSLALPEIQKNINNARFDLLLSDLLFIPFKLFPGEKIDSVQHVISGWRHLTRWLDDTLSLYSSVDDFIGRESINKIYFTQLFSNLYPNLVSINESLSKSLNHYKNISWLPSTDLEQKRISSIKNIEKLQSYLSTIIGDFPNLLSLLWHDGRKRYLIVFQNADEIRPTWGFMGSMWLLEVFKWRVQLFQKKDVYAIEWDLKKSDYERLPAPKWLSELTDTFGLRDANYYANLRDSSETIKFFTDRAWIDLDGVVYINQNILLNLLELSGPVYFEPLDIDISADNFSEVMSLMVEAKTFKKGTLWTPKQVLFDFMEVFTQQLISDGNYFAYLQTLIHDVESRDIMMWSFNENENKLLSDLGINWKIDYDNSLDYMYPVYTSLSGNKSDRYMYRSYKIEVSKNNDTCDFIIHSQIKSSHNMWKQSRDFIQTMMSDYSLNSPNLFQIQWADRNRQFMRVILPPDAQISEKTNTDIVDYGSRKGIEFFLETSEQQAVYYDYDYVLPNTDCLPYSTTVFKQPWISSYNVELNLYWKKFKYKNLEEDFYFEERN
jgi:hypothetical protein